MQRTRIARSVVITGGALALSASLYALTAQEASVSPQAAAAQLRSDSVPEQGSDAQPAAETSVSQVRIVRLSQVRGIVQMDRNTGRGLEAAFANIPVVAGARLRTGEGVAEVEFEDNSSLRLAPDSEIVFGRLGRNAAGGTETTVAVTKGLVFVGLEKTKGNQFALTDGKARVELQPGAHLRLNADQPQIELALFDGTAQVELGGAVTALAKRQTVTLTPASQTISSVEHGTGATDWDEWDKKEIDYHKAKASLAGTGGFGLYGANDLGYYGSFVDMPGCGSMWRPYFASSAWDPFANGVWTWYPSAGYSWVSPYPWGWLPFHSGSWASCGSSGWGWRPGGSWYGLGNTQALRIARHPLPHPVPPAPGRNSSTLVPVNMKQLTMSGPTHGDGFAFRKDSAGFGVPRAGFGNLHSLENHVDRAGVVTRSLPAGGFTAAPPMSAHQVAGPAMGDRRAGVTGGGQTASRSTAFSSASGSRSSASNSAGSSGARSTSSSAPSMSSSSMSTASAPGAAAGGGAHK